MARTLWPAGIHVGLLIVDGVVDLPGTRQAMPDKEDDFFVDPAGLAETAWFLAHQDRRAGASRSRYVPSARAGSPPTTDTDNERFPMT